MIKALLNTIDQGVVLDKVNLTANGDYESTFFTEVGNQKTIRPFLLDMPSDGDMKVQFPCGKIDVFSFREGTSPIVKLIKVFDTGSIVKEFQVIY